MASVLKVDKLDPQSGTALEIGTSGDTVSIPVVALYDTEDKAAIDAKRAEIKLKYPKPGA